MNTVNHKHLKTDMYDSTKDFSADRQQTLCRNDGKQGLYRYGQRLTHEPCEEQDERKPPWHHLRDLYNMRFYRRTFSKKTFECKTKDIETHEGIYCDMLEEIHDGNGTLHPFLSGGGESRPTFFRWAWWRTKKVAKKPLFFRLLAIYGILWVSLQKHWYP